uniref:Uncharacterized protein n=1 Tax=Romanomermis culicivorax TaxID=13658 RepID=A0A915JR86_ROMCU
MSGCICSARLNQTTLLFNLFAASVCLSISQIKRYNEQ